MSPRREDWLAPDWLDPSHPGGGVPPWSSGQLPPIHGQSDSPSSAWVFPPPAPSALVVQSSVVQSSVVQWCAPWLVCSVLCGPGQHNAEVSVMTDGAVLRSLRFQLLVHNGVWRLEWSTRPPLPPAHQATTGVRTPGLVNESGAWCGRELT